MAPLLRLVFGDQLARVYAEEGAFGDLFSRSDACGR